MQALFTTRHVCWQENAGIVIHAQYVAAEVHAEVHAKGMTGITRMRC